MMRYSLTALLIPFAVHAEEVIDTLHTHDMETPVYGEAAPPP